MVVRISAEDKQWQREDDARTLARAEEIIANKSRHTGAIKEAKKMVKDEEKRAAAMKKVASKKKVVKKRAVKKRAVKKRKR